jgi:hypothetical protein
MVGQLRQGKPQYQRPDLVLIIMGHMVRRDSCLLAEYAPRRGVRPFGQSTKIVAPASASWRPRREF